MDANIPLKLWEKSIQFRIMNVLPVVQSGGNVIVLDIEKYKKKGDFVLASGRKSNVYYDVKQMMGEPDNLKEIIQRIRFKHEINWIDVIIGIEYGGIPLAVALSLNTGIPYAVLRKEPKKYGTKNRIEGSNKVGNVLLLDDVITTGGTTNRAKDYLDSNGYKVLAVDCVIDRTDEKGGMVWT
jgi:orotate phosphoribosyltransferase